MHGLPDFSQAHVAVIGDVMLDRYWQGQVGRISPEAPVPVVKMGFEENRLGGAANVALNLSVLGCAAQLSGLIGNDEAGRTLTAEVERRGIQANLIVDAQRPTIVKLRVLAGQHQMMRVDFEEPFAGSPELAVLGDDTRAVVLSDYAKGTLSQVETIIEAAKGRSLPVIVDPKGTDWNRYRGATVLTPNFSEWVAVAGQPSDEDDLADRVGAIIESLELTAVLITRSEKGMSLYQRGQSPIHIATEAKAVADVTGAGDTVVAALAGALGCGQSLEASCRLANSAAGVVVAKVGTSTVTPRELAQARSREISGVAANVDELSQWVAAYQQAGERVVFTNGCFDILHAGHVSYLNEAASLGDRLIVAVNSDRSVSALKGPTRPVNHADQRMAVLAGLQAVDHVIEFDTDTPRELLTAIRPDVLVKGGDYADISEVVGHEIVSGYGGQVHVLGVVAGVSTTNIIEKARR